MFGKKKRKEPKEMIINISSLMDILTILLLFLILSFDSQESNVTPPKDIELPASSSDIAVKLVIKLSLSSEEVRVEDNVVLRMKAGNFKKTDLDKSNLITPLLKELQRQKARLQSGSRAANSSEDETEIVYFECEKGLKYHLVDRVLKTAATAGFTKFRLAVHRAS